MKPITSDILELLHKDSIKHERYRNLLQRVFVLSINYFWRIAPLQTRSWKRKIPVIPAITQNFAQPLTKLSESFPPWEYFSTNAVYMASLPTNAHHCPMWRVSKWMWMWRVSNVNVSNAMSAMQCQQCHHCTMWRVSKCECEECECEESANAHISKDWSMQHHSQNYLAYMR